MPAAQGGPRFDEIALKWHNLAERRLAHLTELYRSGGWKRYYVTQERFALQVLDVIKAVKIWGELADRSRAELPSRHDDDLRPAA